MRAVLLALVLGACAASAPADPMAPLQPLMGLTCPVSSGHG
jgi:hypothetical protein